jgi:hydrogenase maturation protein HypF
VSAVTENRRRFLVDGIVQGVGFRPFVYNLARDETLRGFVTNTSAGVVIEIQGPINRLDSFTHRLEEDAPPLAKIVSVEVESVPLQPHAADRFEIRTSRNTPGTNTLIPPDVATCNDCLREIRDPGDRRCGYAFTNCTNCGPRWTIIGRIPYDRPFTSMASFTMCAACQAEYEDPGNRRFHAQPNACPECGPQLRLVREDDRGIDPVADPLTAAADLLAKGDILAIKGLGGFHLAVRADDDSAVQRLRDRKHREAKPLAVMVPAETRLDCADEELNLLEAPEAPIVLLNRSDLGPALQGAIAPAVAPGHRRLGLMRPYTPLHHLLLDALALRGVSALVMTSGNAGQEPICLGNDEALTRLTGIADAWLLHDRDILRRADDSVVQVLAEQPHFFRRSRGYAPVPVLLRGEHGPAVLAVGPELKNTVCLLKEDRAFLSPHIGDLENLKAYEFFTSTIANLQEVLENEPQVVAHDLHPGYFSTRWAKEWAAVDPERTLIGVQHHHAHLVAVQAERGVPGPAIGLILDGTGYGTDGSIWGGEILAGDATGFQRLGHLEPLALPGGEAAIRAPWRTAVSALRLAYGPDHTRWPELPFLREHDFGPILQMLDKGINCPQTTSCGRLFDALAAMTGRWSEVQYEAQAAIEWMALTSIDAVADAMAGTSAWPVDLTEVESRIVVPVAPLIRAAGSELLAGASPGELSTAFHATLIDLLTRAATEAARRTGLSHVVLAGGVFQNEILLAGLEESLARSGFTPWRPRQTSVNDGSIALGQAVIARAATR